VTAVPASLAAIPILLRTAALLLTLAASGLARASLTISPPQLLPNERNLVVTELRSNEQVGTYWQVRVVRWQQHDGRESLEPAPEVEITPRFVRLGPGKAQVLRVLLPKGDPHYYRVMVEQIPEAASAAAGLRFAFTFSLPIYRSADEPQPRTLDMAPEASCMNVGNDTGKAQVLSASTPLAGPRVVLPGARLTVCRRTDTGT
jgi:P pilus assembly chaperone PapD